MTVVSARFADHVAGTAFELSDPVDVIIAVRPDQVVGAIRAAEAAARAGHHVGGFVTYEAAAGLDAGLAVAPWPAGHPLAGLPLVWFGVFASRRFFDSGGGGAPSPTGWTLDRDEAEHARDVERIRAGIGRGDYYQVNLTARATADNVDARALSASTAAAQRGRHHSLIRTGSVDLVSSSPELFFARDGSTITTRPMKGTARRGRWPAEDLIRAATLRGSAKERAENLMIVDLIRNDLAKVAEVGSVRVHDLFAVERLPTVWQLTSTVTASARPDVDLAELFAALFPSGSVTGAPKAAAMRAIAELEARPRGVYCGAIGWLEPASGADPPLAQFSVGIRTATCVGGYAEYGAGGGITWSSDPASEWNELLAKTAILSTPASPPGLFETLRFDAEGGPVNLARHLARLAASAEFFGFPLDEERLHAVIDEVVRERRTDGRLRVRLTAAGWISAEVDDIPPLPATVRLAVGAEAVDSSDPLLFHKIADRTRYETALASRPDADDVVLHNERGEITETARANLAVRVDGRWWTPPLDCGLLPGVERERLLESGALAERVITVAELQAAQRIALLNSLRGCRPARLV